MTAVVKGKMCFVALALSQIFSGALAQNPNQVPCGPGQKGPCISIPYRKPGEASVSNKTIDCGQAVIVSSDGRKKLIHTFAFFQQADVNNQMIGQDPNPLPTEPRALQTHSKNVFAQGVYHSARVHNDCKTEASQLDAGLGKTSAQLDKIYGANRTQNTSCTYRVVTLACERALGIK